MPHERPRILFLSKGEQAASTRYRALQFFPHLEAAGFEPVHLSVRGGFGRQVAVLRAARSAEVVVSVRRTFSGPMRALLREVSHRLVLDLDDAIYESSTGVSASRARHFKKMVQRCDEVWAGNQTLKARATADGARSAKVFPTAVDPQRYAVKSHNERDWRCLVWIGSGSTRPYLEAILPALEAAAAAAAGLRLRIVADFALKSEVLPIEAVAWSSEAEAEALATAGIGLGPLADSAWTRGKCGFKLLQYMAAGLPTICDPVGANGEIVIDGETGLHITANHSWTQAIQTLCGNPSRAVALGRTGRQRVEQHYSVQHVGQQMIDALRALLA